MQKLWMILALLSTCAFASDDYVYITVGSDAVNATNKSVESEIIKLDSDISVMKVHKEDIDIMSHMMHGEFKRCGGYMLHDSKEEAYCSRRNDEDIIHSRLSPRSCEHWDYCWGPGIRFVSSEREMCWSAQHPSFQSFHVVQWT